jgi:thymidine kinase
MNFKGKPFGPMPNLLAIADYVTKLHAICVKCGSIANFSYRKSPKEEQVVLGELDMYEPRCRNCFYLKD